VASGKFLDVVGFKNSFKLVSADIRVLLHILSARKLPTINVSLAPKIQIFLVHISLLHHEAPERLTVLFVGNIVLVIMEFVFLEKTNSTYTGSL
jgi:hypothetical protein